MTVHEERQCYYVYMLIMEGGKVTFWCRPTGLWERRITIDPEWELMARGQFRCQVWARSPEHAVGVALGLTDYEISQGRLRELIGEEEWQALKEAEVYG